jgi:hypothetical protein
MKNKINSGIFLFQLILISSLNSYAQMGWTRITDPFNPIISSLGNGTYKGAAWVDIDGDNDQDLFTNNRFLFENMGADSFRLKTTIIGQSVLQTPGGSSWADLDNDGDMDCVYANHPSGLFLNDGTGTFNEVTSQLDSLSNYPAWGCAIGNWNNDELLDFIYVHAAGFHSGIAQTCRIFKQNGSTFSPEPEYGYLFTDSFRPYTVPYWSDYDLDGDMDLFLASGPGGSPGPDYCFRNMLTETGTDTLIKMTTELFSQQLQDGQCYNFIDYDNDGDFDLCLTNYRGAPTRLYNNNSGIYTETTTPFSGTAINNLSNNWGDFDNDGDLDVIITNDITTTKYYENLGNGNFNYLSGGLTGPSGGAGVTNSDYDNDGDLDVYIHGTNNGKRLLRNDSVATNRNWINIKLKGVISNSSAIGAKVRIVATINGNLTSQLREVNAQNSFQSQNDLRVHFGLGDAILIDSISIFWPSGSNQHFTNIAVDSFYIADENAGLSTINGINNPGTDLQKSLILYPNPTSEKIFIKKENHIKIKRITISDYTGKLIDAKLTEENEILTTSFKKGIYLINIETNIGTLSEKIIVE